MSGSDYWKEHDLLLSSPNQGFEQINKMKTKFKVLFWKAPSQGKV